MAVHHDVVTDLEVVPERELDVIKALEIASAALEDVRGEGSPKTHSKSYVIAKRGFVEQLPEPEERLDLVVLVLIDLGVVFRL